MSKPWPDIRQNEAAECGLACLAQIATFHGHQTSLGRLRKRYGLSLRGASLQNLITVADGLGLAARPIRFDMEDLGELSLPCVLHWDFNHFVVLIRIDRRRLHIHDPAFGPRTITRKAASNHITGVALELTPTPVFRKRVDRDRVKLSSFWSSIRGMKRSLLQLAAYALILELFSLASPLYLQFVVDEAVGKGDISLVGLLAVGILLIALFQTVVEYVRSHADLTLSTSLSRQMQTNLFTHMLRLPLGWFERRHVGDVVSRFASLNPIQTSLTAGLINVSLDGVFSIITLILMVFYSGWLTIVALIILASALAVRFLSFRAMRGLTYEQIDSGAKEDTAFLEVMRSIRPIKAFGREDERGVVWQNAYSRLVASNVKMASFGIRLQTIESVIWGLHGVLILYLGARQINAGAMSLGMLLAFQAYNGQFNGRIVALVDELLRFRMLRLHLDRLSDIVQTDREDQRGAVKRLDVNGRIELHNVEYRYSPLDKAVVKNLDVTFEAGSCTAILGPSGAGKSTLVKLLAGLVTPTGGALVVDGVDLSQVDLRSFRRQIGVVMQDDTLMSGSVLDNIAFFSPEPDVAWVEECARQACVHDDVLKMSMRYASLVGDHGNALSGGQRQRLLLARALYQRPRVLIVDEGTANLDLETEERVVSSIGAMSITRILITHRPRLLAIADATLRLEHGRLSIIEPQPEVAVAAE